LPTEPSLSERIVIVHQGALGDFLLVLSVLEGLHLCHPEIRMGFWTRPEHFQLIKDKIYADGFHPSGGPELLPFFDAERWSRAAPPSFFENSRAVLFFGQESSRPVAERLARRMSSPVHWVRSFPGEGGAVHASRFVAEQMRALGWEIRDTIARITPSPEERRHVEQWLGEGPDGAGARPIVVHPGSGGRAKIWPLGKWWGLLEWVCIEIGAPILMVLGPADEHLRAFGEAAQWIGVRVVEGLSLPRLAALLSGCRLYIGNDSGVSHLAAATSIPAVVIFGPTDPRVWAPGGANVRIIRAAWDPSTNLLWPPSTVEPPDEEVKSAVEEFLPTRR
jgi:heptosyltransferase III